MSKNSDFEPEKSSDVKEDVSEVSLVCYPMLQGTCSRTLFECRTRESLDTLGTVSQKA